MIAGGAVGYVLGARAGEQGYREITETARRFTQRQEVKRAGERAVAKVDQLSGQAADRVQKVRQSIRTEEGDSGSRPITAVPDMPAEPRPQPAAVPPEATAPPDRAAPPARRRRQPPPEPPS